MKYFLLEPTYKKSVVEYTTFVKKTEDATIRATREEGYRWGSWIIKVPETVEDAVEWCADMNCSFEDDFENDLDALIESATPDVNNDFHEVDDYNNEFVELFDGCWADWTIHVTGDGKDNYDEEEIQEEETLSLQDKELELIIKSLERNQGKRKAAAAELGISERTLYRKIKQHNLEL
mgnify:CR=1 FL=1